VSGAIGSILGPLDGLGANVSRQAVDGILEPAADAREQIPGVFLSVDRRDETAQEQQPGPHAQSIPEYKLGGMGLLRYFQMLAGFRSLARCQFRARRPY
jgi:hypothetical protein